MATAATSLISGPKPGDRSHPAPRCDLELASQVFQSRKASLPFVGILFVPHPDPGLEGIQAELLLLDRDCSLLVRLGAKDPVEGGESVLGSLELKTARNGRE